MRVRSCKHEECGGFLGKASVTFALSYNSEVMPTSTCVFSGVPFWALFGVERGWHAVRSLFNLSTLRRLEDVQ